MALALVRTKANIRTSIFLQLLPFRPYLCIFFRYLIVVALVKGSRIISEYDLLSQIADITARIASPRTNLQQHGHSQYEHLLPSHNIR